MKLIICGDICPSFIEEEFLSLTEKELFGEVLDSFKRADRVLINLECAVTDKGDPINKKGPNLKVSSKCLETLKNAGVTDCGISNNHIFDYGVSGVTDTINKITSLEMNYTGFGDNYEDSRKNLVMEKNGKTVAIIAVCEHEYSYALDNRMGARPFDPFDTIEDIREAKEKYDYVIVTYHGGKEHCLYPSPRLVKASRAMIKAGADVVLCQHSHCIGCYEEYKGGHILYGQGNFHFIDTRKTMPHLLNGLMVEIDITDKLDFKMIPVEIKGFGIDFARGESYDKIMTPFRERSDNLHNGVWLEEWDKFCKDATSIERYLGNIERVFTDKATDADKDLFCGRMHCEAHKDVINWLCKHPWENEVL